jgi:NAD(P)H-hydrate repair Nnr-like enzyme with NAD(P)H-hydrate dehydratase domain/predicted transcriptional regulator
VIRAGGAGAEEALRGAVEGADLIIDAIYGIGGREELPGDLVAALALVNARAADPRATLVALDIPTGVNADTGAAADGAFQASLTVTLGRPKVGLYQPAGMRAAGRIAIESIGLDEGSLPDDAPRLIERADAAARLPRRAFDAHKGDAGSLMIVGGSLNYLGAPVLAAHAALRAGVGLLTLAVPRSLLGPIAMQVAEATYLPLPESEWGTIGRDAAKTVTEALGRYTAIQIGNGLGREKATGEFLANLLALAPRDRAKGPVGFRPNSAAAEEEAAESPIKVPVLFDADGLNLLSEIERWWEKLADLRLILTPHHGELARLRGVEREAISAVPWQGGARRCPRMGPDDRAEGRLHGRRHARRRPLGGTARQPRPRRRRDRRHPGRADRRPAGAGADPGRRRHPRPLARFARWRPRPRGDRHLAADRRRPPTLHRPSPCRARAGHDAGISTNYEVRSTRRCCPSPYFVLYTGGSMRVTEFMTADIATVAPETPIVDVARLMVGARISGVPVINRDTGELLGMITELEMVERQAKFEMPTYTRVLDATFVIAERDSEEKLARILATTAGELMQSTVYSIREDATIEDVASLMFERQVNPVPVISLDDRLIGIISRSDIVRLMAADFTELGGEVSDE